MTILITGATGNIGGEVIEHLLTEIQAKPTSFKSGM